MKQLKSFDFTDAQRKKLASIILKLDKEKQDILISGDNIATINGQSLLNGGNISLIKTGIFSIVTKLPTNDIDKDKVYLVPSKETNDENKFSEYIYTDNGWEKLGTFTADVDLSPYSKALYLPKYIIGQDVDGGDIISSHYYSNKVKVMFVRVNLIDNSELNDWFDIHEATTAYAGVMSYIDKRKLNSIEKNAQVNKIESISVNGTPLEITNRGVDIPLVDTKNAGILPAINNTSYSPSYLMTNINPVTNQRNYKWGSIDIASFIQDNKDVGIRITNVGNITFSNIFSEGIKIGSNNNTSIHFKVILNPSINNILTLDDNGLFVDKTSIDTGVTGIKLAGYTSDEDITLDVVDGIVNIPLATPTTQGLMDVGDRTFIDNIGQKLVDNGWVQGDSGGQGPKIAPTNKKYTGERPLSLQYKHSQVDGQGKVFEQTVDDIIPYATSEQGGMMSKADKTKLDSLENYNLPAATTTTLGGVNVGNLNGQIPSILHIKYGNLTARVSLHYIKESKILELVDFINGSKLSVIDCTDFIKDGMLESANVVVNPEGHDAGTYIKLVFNTDAGKDPVYINVSDLIHEYTAGNGINIENGVISTTPISIKTENFSFVSSGSHQPTYNYSGVTIYDDRYISGTKYGIAFDESDIQLRTVMTSPDGVRTACFALNGSTRIKINNAITSISINNIGQVNTNGAVNLTIPNASITENGLMSKEDKAKLDSQPTIKASNATGVTDDDYVVIKKSELNSILSRLSALENKA